MNKNIIEKHKQAGKIVHDALELGRTLIKPGAKVYDIVREIQNFINSKAKLAFPINLSFDYVAAHDTADHNDERLIPNDAVIKLDVGCHIDGYIADSAITIDLSGKHSKLLEATEKALENALKICVPGTTIGSIGKVIQETIESYGFKPIVNLSGHYIERYQLHTGLSIPNVATDNDIELEEGDVIAVEPFSTDGSGKIHESSNPKIFLLKKKLPMRLANAKKLIGLIDSEFDNLPFSYQQLFDLDMDKARIPMAFSLIKRSGALHDFPPLVEDNKGIVAQFEHTVIVFDEPIVISK